MRALIVIILLILMPAWPCVAAETRAVQGHVNLSEVNWHQEATIPLTGEWELYWNQLLTPTAIEAGQGKLSAYLPPETEWH
ncbi:MAG: hypothetical protein M3Q07_08295, partial [Pseudobdellovibrionaceae bacterium]|nr:hypothetical protein [Pseudobdellovibrionaceae bacterium]